mmetsp:Transcript_14147/g.12487  ORF Transcript_14147/g.12487 Transcript_14147/m.12487 type:complete len:100 (+) Transcript_14147:816-1115(+)
MKEVKYTPDLSKTERYNSQVSRTVVNFKRQKSIKKHMNKSNKRKQDKLKQKQTVRDGCTFKPKINKKSSNLNRSFSALLVPCKVKMRQNKIHKIEHLEF